MYRIDHGSGVPIYEQLYRKTVELIVHGVLKQDDSLPSVRALAKELCVNPNTVQKAFAELERDGVIYSVAKKGSFVAMINKDVVGEKVLEELKEAIQHVKDLGFTTEEIMNRIKEWENDRIEKC